MAKAGVADTNLADISQMEFSAFINASFWDSADYTILVFTMSVVVVTLMMAAPFAGLLRHMAAGVVPMAVASIGLFGWFLPYFAA